MEAIVTIVAMTTVSSSEETVTKVRFWRSIDGRNCVGRFVPCLHERSADEIAKAEADREFVRGQEVGEIEINLQLGTFSLSTSRLEGVDERIAAFSDFKDLFGIEGSKVQCAAVRITKKRMWMRMVGRRHDLQLWKPDERAVRVPFTRKYPESLLSSEHWISEILEDCRKQNSLLPGVQSLYIEESSYSDKSVVARLCGYQVILDDNSTVLREGELQKLGGALANKWNSRWFVLTGSQLNYYEKQKDVSKQPRGTIKLTEIKEVGEVSDAPYDFYFLTQGGKTYHLRASDAAEKLEWIRTLAPKSSMVELVIFRQQVESSHYFCAILYFTFMTFHCCSVSCTCTILWSTADDYTGSLSSPPTGILPYMTCPRSIHPILAELLQFVHLPLERAPPATFLSQCWRTILS